MGHVHLLITGGTIDSAYHPSSDSMLVNDSSVIREYVDKLIQPHFKLTSKVLCMKDSRLITDAVRDDIIDSIISAPTDNIIVSHGTYTMAASASYVAKYRDKFPSRKIFFVGSFFPLYGFTESDAPFNLGFAFASCLLSEPGVYLAMNGRVFSPDKVGKNISQARFEEI